MKKIIKYIQYCLILISICINTSACQKYKEPPQENLGLLTLGEAKDYLLFKPGSWWVYKNSYTNEMDTMILYFCSLDTVKATPSTLRTFEYEEIGFGITSLRDNTIYNYFDHGMSAEVTDFKPRWGWECSRKGGFNQRDGNSYHFYYPFDNNTTHGNGYSTTRFIEKKDSMVIKGNSYYGIAVFSVLQDRAYPYPNIKIQERGNSTYYWARNVGIIKIKHISTDEQDINEIKMNWELLESHIYK